MLGKLFVGDQTRINWDKKLNNFNSQVSQVSNNLKNKAYGVNLIHHVQPKQQISKINATLTKLKEQSSHWRKQSQRWQQESSKWRQLFWNIAILAAIVIIVCFILPALYNKYENFQKQKKLHEQYKLQVSAYIHQKISQLLKRYEKQIKDGAIEINKSFTFQKYQTQCSFKLRMVFQNSKMSHSYQIKGNIGNQLQIYEEFGNYYQKSNPTGWCWFWVSFFVLIVAIFSIVYLMELPQRSFEQMQVKRDWRQMIFSFVVITIALFSYEKLGVSLDLILVVVGAIAVKFIPILRKDYYYPRRKQQSQELMSLFWSIILTVIALCLYEKSGVSWSWILVFVGRFVIRKSQFLK